MNTARPIPSTQAIATAVRNGQRDAHQYTAAPIDPEIRICWWVRAKDGHSTYLILVPDITIPGGLCDCPFHEQEGYCKHVYLAQEEGHGWDQADEEHDADPVHPHIPGLGV